MKNLKTIIKNNGKTCKEISEILGISKQNFSYKCKNFNEGKILFSRKELEKMAVYLEISIENFFE